MSESAADRLAKAARTLMPLYGRQMEIAGLPNWQCVREVMELAEALREYEAEAEVRKHQGQAFQALEAWQHSRTVEDIRLMGPEEVHLFTIAQCINAAIMCVVEEAKIDKLLAARNAGKAKP